jgi:GxxExxY protein
MVQDIDRISHDVIGVAMRLHREIGPGLLESVYETLLAGRLGAMGYKVDRQWPINIIFDGIEFTEVARVDLLVDERLVVEIKSADAVHPVHSKQGSHLFEVAPPARRTADQFWSGYSEGRYPTPRERP